MSHELQTDADGVTRFAFNNRQDAWHRLGNPVRPEDTTPEQMMETARAGFRVGLTQIIATDDEGQPLYNGFDSEGRPNWVYVNNSRATVRFDTDGSIDGLATVGTRYEVTQNMEVMERALAIVGAAKGDARIDTVGVIHGGRGFFTTISLDGLVLELPDGVKDPIARYLIASTSHDGRIPITFTNGDTRVVCQNTLTMSNRLARRTFKARHTRNGVGFTTEEAQTALAISTKWAEGFKAQATALASVRDDGRLLDKVLAHAFPLATDATDRQKRNHDAIVGSIRGLYKSDTNAGKFGQNGWTVYNAVGEYLDHLREGSERDRALTSMDPDSWVSKTKLAVEARILQAV